MHTDTRKHVYNIFAACALITFGVIGRLALQGHPNVETVTVVSLLAGLMLGGMYAVVVPLGVIAITDIFIGNEIILLYTWSAWLIIGLMALLVRKYTKLSQSGTGTFTLGMGALGIVASLFFYIWTNFGVWQLFDYYPAGLSGLMDSYIAGLPFLKISLVSNIIIVPVVSVIYLGISRFATLRIEAHKPSKTVSN